MMKRLNDGQRKFVFHVVDEIEENVKPVRAFLSGSAGVGKSTVINCLYQAVTYYFDC